jgi:hypothetical protein
MQDDYKKQRIIKLQDQISYKIMCDALEAYKKKRGTNEINYSELSDQTGCTISSLWFYFKGQRRWPADAFMRVLSCIGALHHNENSILIAYNNKVPEESNVLKQT